MDHLNKQGFKKLLIGLSVPLIISAYVVQAKTASLSNEVDDYPPLTDVEERPAHQMNYMLGLAEDVESSTESYNAQTKTARAVIQAQIDERLEAERLKREEEERIDRERKEAEEKARFVEEARLEAGRLEEARLKAIEEEKAKAEAQARAEAEKPAQNAPAPAPKTPAPAPKTPTPNPAPAPAPQSIGANKIGVNGIYKTYVNYGAAYNDTIQGAIDKGQIAAALTVFNPSDNQTTYFGGHNPGIMNFMEKNIYKGATVTVTDSNGNPHHYKITDHFDTDTNGQSTFQTIGHSAVSVYNYGSNEESILIQFCNTANDLMSLWYGIKQ